MLDLIDRKSEVNLIDQIDPLRMKEHLNKLREYNRLSSTQDEYEACGYIIETLDTYGVETELLEYMAYVSIPEDARISITKPINRTIDDAITSSFGGCTPPNGVSGDLVYIPHISNDIVNSMSVENKIVLTSKVPDPELVKMAERFGLNALICESPRRNLLYETMVNPVWGMPSIDDVERLPEIPVVQIDPKEGTWLKNHLEQGAVQATIETEVETKLAELPLPIGRIKGSMSDRYFVIGNHIDSWYAGVTDNATSVAATLEIARIFAQRDVRRGLLLGFWSGHEIGPYAGSAWYADEHWLDLRKNGIGYLMLDLLGLKGENKLYYQHMAELEEESLDIMRKRTDLPLAERDEDGPFSGETRPGRRGDQSFWGTGLSSLQIGSRLTGDDAGPVGGGWWWHTREDTLDKADIQVLTQETSIAIGLATRICESPVLPHDFTNTINDFRSGLDSIERSSGSVMSFDDLHTRLDRLEDQLERMYRVADEAANGDAYVAGRVEDLQVVVGNLLIPTLYVKTTEYAHDPVLPQKVLPGLRVAENLPNLDSPEYEFVEKKVKRRKTKLAHRIDQATKNVDEFLDWYEGYV